jgi:hypothetical protein
MVKSGLLYWVRAKMWITGCEKVRGQETTSYVGSVRNCDYRGLRKRVRVKMWITWVEKHGLGLCGRRRWQSKMFLCMHGSSRGEESGVKWLVIARLRNASYAWSCAREWILKQGDNCFLCAKLRNDFS